MVLTHVTNDGIHKVTEDISDIPQTENVDGEVDPTHCDTAAIAIDGVISNDAVAIATNVSDAAVYMGHSGTTTNNASFSQRSRNSPLSTTPMSIGNAMPPRFPPFRESYGDMSELRKELKVISVQMNAPYFMHHSSPQRLEARCPTWKNRKHASTSPCEFVVAANRHTNGRVYITRANVSHSVDCVAVQGSGSHVSAAAMMETAKSFMEKLPDTVKPRDMAHIMKERFGVSATYMTAWRALTAFKQEKKQEETTSFAKISGYLDTFVKSNEGSVAAFEHVANTTIFSRAFLCPKPLQTTVQYCRPTVLLSVYLITSIHGGIVMSATTQDAMGENVPMAIGIALHESEDNWRFFLEHLGQAIPDFERSVASLVHNRGLELQQAAAAVFPGCVQSDAVDTFISPPIPPFANSVLPSVMQMSPQTPIQWMEGLCTKSPLMILVGWVSKVASLLYQRHETYEKMSGEYPDVFHELLSRYEAEAEHYQVLRIAEHGYEVIAQHTGRQRVVDFAKRTCSCGEYDASRFPCLHVFLALTFAGLVRADVIPQIFLMSSLKALYDGRVTPIDVETVVSDNVTVPHPVVKTRGRPRKVQQIQQFTDVKHEKLACSVCGVKGHNKRTCKRMMSTMGMTDDQSFLDGTYDGDVELHTDVQLDASAGGTVGEPLSEDQSSSKRRKLLKSSNRHEDCLV